MTQSYYEPPRPKSNGALVVVLSFVVAVIAAAGLHLLTRGQKVTADAAGVGDGVARVGLVPVPDLEGLAVARARDLVRDGGIALHVLGTRPAGGVDSARIARQVPLPGSLVATGGAIEVYLDGAAAVGTPSGVVPPAPGPSAPVEVTQIEVPDVNGLVLVGASRVLKQAGLALGEVTEKSNYEAEEGTIVAQQPEPGQNVALGAAIDVTVAGPPAVVKVPRLTRLDGDAARRRLVGLGLRTRSEEMFHPGIPAGHVIRTKPAAGESVEPGSSVLVIVAE